MNEQWHRDHPLGSGSSLDERVAWHVEHAKACGCRPIPDSVAAEVRARGLGRSRST
jgi:hypothetical protein